MLKYGKRSDEVINRSVENMERLDKLLAATGKWSRKEAKALIKAGRVRVEDRLPKGPEDKVEEGSLVTVDGKPIFTEKYVYLMLHKPAGVISATQDAKEKTVLDLLPKDLRRKDLFPVGRLDKDTEGLLLLTNDGALAHALLAPGRHVDKVYYAKIDGMVTEEDVKRFAEGIDIGAEEEEMTRPAKLDIMKSAEESEIRLTIHEGKFHQVKRMFLAVGKEVTYLKRERMGTLCLDENLKPGEYRLLTEEEIENVRK